MRALVATLCALPLVAACGQSGGIRDEDLAGLVTAASSKQPAPIDLTRAGRDSGELARALAQPWTAAAAPLGDHTLTISHTVEVRDGATVLETLGERTTLEVAKDGSYHATYENTADYGREVVFLAPSAALYLRPRYARWHRRAPETPEEPAAIRDQLAGVAGADFELVAHGAEVSDKGKAMVAGRAGRRVEIKRAPKPRAAPRQTLVQRGWRDDATVEAITGEVVLDEQTGAPLEASLDATVGFVRDGKHLTMRLTLTQAAAAATPAIAAPAEELVVATPVRSREVDERNQLLEGIAPPIRKAAPPSGGSGTGSPATPATTPTPTPAPAADKAVKP